MQRLINESDTSTTVSELCAEFRANNFIQKDEYDYYRVKRGLRNQDGTGVMAGLTHVCNVHGYLIDDGDKVPDEGRLTYRGMNVSDIIAGCRAEGRFAYEEIVWLLIFGKLPDARQYNRICQLLYENRELPEYFPEDVIMKNPSKDVMNKLARAVLTLYSYDDDPDDLSLENNMRQSISLIARMPAIMAYAYQVKRRHFDKQTMFFHPFEPQHRTAEAILNSIREDRSFTREEAELLDLCMVLHAEHGGGNNSTFTDHVVTSSGTDTYSAICAAISSLKGPRHGGANLKVQQMFDDLKAHVQNWEDEDAIRNYLIGILDKKEFDQSGLIYGLGHAVYTLSDPREVILKRFAKKLSEEKGLEKEFALYDSVERIGLECMKEKRHLLKPVCANVDFYSGFVYTMLGIPRELFTPIFAISRISGWSAHRLEELVNKGKIIRPAYQYGGEHKEYHDLKGREGNK